MTVFWIIMLFAMAAILGVMTIYLAYVAVMTSPRHEVRRRLRNLALDVSDRRFPSDLRIEILREMSPTERFLYRSGLIRRLHNLMEGAGLHADVKLWLLVISGSGVFGAMAGLIFGGGLISGLFSAAGLLIPIVYLRTKRQKRLFRFTEQFPDALDMIARSLRAGHSFSAAIQLVGTELPDPVKTLFHNAHEEQTLGLSMRDALSNMSKRMPSTDLSFFVMATGIHREIGGNLGEILERLAQTIRERIRIRRQVRVYTAQARLSGYVLAAAPVFMSALFYVLLPGYIEEIFTVDWGKYALFLAVAAQILGFFVIRKIINIRI